MTATESGSEVLSGIIEVGSYSMVTELPELLEEVDLPGGYAYTQDAYRGGLVADDPSSSSNDIEYV